MKRWEVKPPQIVQNTSRPPAECAMDTEALLTPETAARFEMVRARTTSRLIERQRALGTAKLRRDQSIEEFEDW